MLTRDRHAIRGEEILKPLVKTSILDRVRLASKITKTVGLKGKVLASL